MDKSIRLLLLILLFAAVQSINAQVQKESLAQAVSTENVNGTFIMEFLDVREAYPMPITKELLLQIESNRDQSRTVYLQLNTYCRVKIFSKDEISREDFVKPSQDYVLVEKFEQQ